MLEQIQTAFKTAEDYMYRRKLLDGQSSHSVLLSAIKATMLEKSHETKEHAERLAALSKEVGKRMGIHPLELDEWTEMRKHPEIGYRIAMSSSALEPIAPYIISHHTNQGLSRGRLQRSSAQGNKAAFRHSVRSRSC